MTPPPPIAPPVSEQDADHRCVLHIGLPKTGSKLLQWHLFARHSEVDFLGLYIGDVARPYQQFGNCRTAAVESVMQELLWKNVGNPDIERCREIIKASILPAFDNGKIPVWSWESLATDNLKVRRMRARNLYNAFGSCKIIAAVRHPFDLLESAYFQMLKRENLSVPFRRLDGGRAAYCIGIKKWLEDHFGDVVMEHLDYAKTINIYSELFGKNAVAVFLYEDLRENTPVHIENVCRFIGINAAEGVTLTDGKQVNLRWTQKQFENLKHIQASMLRSLLFRFTYNTKRHRVLGFRSNPGLRVGPPARVAIPKVWKRKISDVTRNGNRWLEQEWGLPLQRYGYPL